MVLVVLLPLQIHILESGEVRVFSRNQEDNTSKYPDIISRIPKVTDSSTRSAAARPPGRTAVIFKWGFYGDAENNCTHSSHSLAFLSPLLLIPSLICWVFHAQHPPAFFVLSAVICLCLKPPHSSYLATWLSIPNTFLFHSLILTKKNPVVFLVMCFDDPSILFWSFATDGGKKYSIVRCLAFKLYTI